jgi:hypothetical protein
MAWTKRLCTIESDKCILMFFMHFINGVISITYKYVDTTTCDVINKRMV